MAYFASLPVNKPIVRVTVEHKIIVAVRTESVKQMKTLPAAANPTEPIFLRVSEAARLLAMSRGSVYEAIKKKTIPAISIDGKLRIPRAALDDLVKRALAEAL